MSESESIIIKGSAKVCVVDGEFVVEQQLRNGKYCFTRKQDQDCDGEKKRKEGAIYFDTERTWGGKSYWKISGRNTGITSTGFSSVLEIDLVLDLIQRIILLRQDQRIKLLLFEGWNYSQLPNDEESMYPPFGSWSKSLTHPHDSPTDLDYWNLSLELVCFLSLFFFIIS